MLGKLLAARKAKAGARTYRFDFALIVLTGNIARYQIVRPLVEQDNSVIARWYPIRTWYEGDRLQFLPGALRLRARHFLDSWLLYVRRPADATIIHAFETYYLYVAIQRFFRRKVVIVKNPDGTLDLNAKSHFAAKRTDLFVPWSSWAAEHLRTNFPEVAKEKIVTMHPGINLRDWPMREPKQPGERFRILFVGGDYLRKGGDTLLRAFTEHLSDDCELHIATQSDFLPANEYLRITAAPHAHLHLDMRAGTEELKALYRQSDCFILPTNEDASSWVAIEALAMGIPTIITATGGIPDIVIGEQTGLIIPPKDPAAIAAAVRRLQQEPELTEKLIRQGRQHIEEHFDASKNTQRLLDLIKALVDRRKQPAKHKTI